MGGLRRRGVCLPDPERSHAAKEQNPMTPMLALSRTLPAGGGRGGMTPGTGGGPAGPGLGFGSGAGEGSGDGVGSDSGEGSGNEPLNSRTMNEQHQEAGQRPSMNGGCWR
jgi:hypothetical protein